MKVSKLWMFKQFKHFFLFERVSIFWPVIVWSLCFKYSYIFSQVYLFETLEYRRSKSFPRSSKFQRGKIWGRGPFFKLVSGSFFIFSKHKCYLGIGTTNKTHFSWSSRKVLELHYFLVNIHYYHCPPFQIL